MMIKYLKQYYLLGVAIVATVVFGTYHSSIFSEDYSEALTEFQKKFISAEKRLDEVLEFKANQVSGKEIEPLWEKLEPHENINIHIYRNDSLIFWNTNQLPIIRFAEIHFPAEGVLNLQNGWYYAKTKQTSDYLICASFLIKNDYAYENMHLVNGFSELTPFPYEADVMIDKDRGSPIFNNAGQYICSIDVAEDQTVDQQQSVTLLLLLLLAIILWLVWLFRMVLKRKAYWSWAVVVGVLIARFLALEYDWFYFMRETEACNPAVYGVNDWLPNFLEYCLHIVVLVFAMSVIRVNIDKWKPSLSSKIAAYVLPLLVLLPWALLLYFIKTLIENSTIPLLINKLFSLDSFSVLSIASFGVYFYTYFILVRSIVDLGRKNNVLGSRTAVIYFAVCCLYLLYEVNYGYSLLYAGIFPMIFTGALLYLVIITQSSRRLGSGLFILFAFAATMSLTIDDLESRKERGEKELYANQIATEKDIVTEAEYASLAPKLDDDKFLKKLIVSKTPIRISDFQENMERRFFNGFWERYEMKFSLFDSRHLPIIDKVENSTADYDALQEIIKNSGVPSEIDSNIFFISDYRNQYNYIIRQPMQSEDSTATFFVTLKSTKIPEEIGFPRLLISGKTAVFESLENYSIAKYHGSNLLNKYGEFNYPTSIGKLVDNTKEGSQFIDFGGYNHFVLRKSPEYTVVLSSKNPESIELLTSFSYLFSFYGLMILPLLFRLNRSAGSRKTLSLAMKIQLVLISLVFLSLLAFGWGSGIFVSNQHHEYTHDVIREKLNSVNAEVGAKLGELESLSIEENGDRMQFYLEKFARVFFTDINLYDTDGYLLATSRPKVFNSGLISEQMNPEAYSQICYGERSEYMGHEHIGNLSYSSAYMPFYNKNGELLAYINLQHFGQQDEFENQIQQFLVAIINVFVLLLALSILLAIFISNWLTSPLRILQESFAAVQFGQHNEHIYYNKEDEIGSLVKDYNQKLEELEFAAQQLAKSERESAWREMAKQVAHEIKNPLTPMKLSVQQLLRSYDASDPKSEEKLRKVANSIIEQIDALTKISNEFSNFAKMPLPTEEELNIVSLISSSKQLFLEEGRVSIKVKSDVPEALIRADKNQMIRVFNNLFKNAIQASAEKEKSEIKVVIETTETHVKIFVQDNGVGIDEDQQSKIFVPYFTTKSTGTGLGLAMVRQIIENHRGTIDFETEKGVGTTFIIELPLSIHE